MQAVTITQITPPELTNLIEAALRNILADQPQVCTPNKDELLTVPDAAKFLRLSVPTIYGLIHKGEIPVMKRSKRCYFYKDELVNYIKQGRKKTEADIANDTDAFLSTKKRKEVCHA